MWYNCLIAENIYVAEDDDEEVFNDLIKYLFSVFTQTSINDNNSLEIETALLILSKVFGFIYDKLKNDKIVKLVKAFRIYFKSTNMNLRAKCSEAIAEIFRVINDKDKKKFKEFLTSILETTRECFENPKEETNVIIYHKFIN